VERLWAFYYVGCFLGAVSRTTAIHLILPEQGTKPCQIRTL
jgi:hypothetical protein